MTTKVATVYSLVNIEAVFVVGILDSHVRLMWGLRGTATVSTIYVIQCILSISGIPEMGEKKTVSVKLQELAEFWSVIEKCRTVACMYRS